ncbi:hypothetical protein KUCAC02_020332 [Chaenocephalus aceratus]|uniref:Uncharacterized protein n=1 Tax=Chaenocephalus aceratus TaxID=36190 RepID=A0ACB9VRU0_CHAAC|nr:hypothetical protein KUCAC02_020332 [Chaenocephalus aceratus]
MWLPCGCTSKTIVTSYARRVFKSYFCVFGRWKCNVAALMPEAVGFEGVKDYSSLQEFSVSNSASFWAAAARHRLSWIKPFHMVQDCDLSLGRIKWFEGGQLNVSVNCLDRHVHTCPERVALIWERDEPGSEIKVTYRQLLEMTCRLGNLLRRHGVKKGDCVTIYMPPCPLAVASMLACARIGAAHNVVFAGFSAEALAERIRDAQSSTVITVNQGVESGEGDGAEEDAKDMNMEEEMLKEDVVCEPEAMDSEDVLFLLYTSGSTGKPKGVVHTQAGYLLYAALTHRYVFSYQDGDVFGCVADIGWITGHSYTLPYYPDPGRYWEMVQRLKINQFYGAPTAIRLLLKYGDQWGEPINTEAWEWYHRVVGNGRCPVVDTWWQTETGGICITPRPSDPDAEIVPGMAMRPFFGIKPGKVVTSNPASGALCLAQPWPGMARTIHNNHQRFIETYCQPHPGYFFTGDGAYRSKEGYYQITGRLDDVINVSGHRIGTAEIEDVVNQCSAVAESAVIGYSHDIKGQWGQNIYFSVYAFVVLKKDADDQEADLSQQLNNMVSKKIAKYACPDFVQFVQRLPKTRSGKIMRRVLRKVVERDLDGLDDLSTLDDPAAVQEIIQGHRELCGKQQPA